MNPKLKAVLVPNRLSEREFAEFIHLMRLRQKKSDIPISPEEERAHAILLEESLVGAYDQTWADECALALASRAPIARRNRLGEQTARHLIQ